MARLIYVSSSPPQGGPTPPASPQLHRKPANEEGYELLVPQCVFYTG
jgi:hypothetical protein